MLSRGQPCPKPTPRIEAKKALRALEAKELRDCYAKVDLRDGPRCRVCCRWCSPGAIGMLQRAERHHMVYRSRGGQHTTENVLTVCKHTCHTAIHVEGVLRLTGNADLRDVITGKFNGVTVQKRTEAGWVVERMC